MTEKKTGCETLVLSSPSTQIRMLGMTRSKVPVLRSVGMETSALSAIVVFQVVGRVERVKGTSR